MNILITGGEGYIGSKLKLALEGKGHDVETYDLPKNILNEREFREAVCDKDMCFHLAALAELKYTDRHPQETFDVNVVGTNVVAKVCSQMDVKLNFTSTCCIYGNPTNVSSKEDEMVRPTDTYAMSKAAGEYVVKMWGLANCLKYNILRFGTVYGASTKREMRGDMCIQKFMEAAINKTDMEVTGDGEQARNFIHIDDLVRALVLVAEKNPTGETINIAGNERITVNMIAKYAQRLGAKKINYVPKRKDDFFDQDISLRKAHELLGWKPRIKFEDGIKQFYDTICYL